MTPRKRARRAKLGASAGVLTASAGLGWELGAGWGLLLLGAAMTILFLLGYDVDGGGSE